MANIVISPNMNLPIPVVSTDPGPDWATNVDACLTAIDGHDHTSGQGVPITPSGLDINADLPMGDNSLTATKSVVMTSQVSPLSTILALYASGVDLYYTDGSGNQVRLTQSGSVTGSTGTITGLPSGTASASFAGSTFTFESATATPAIMAVGPLAIGANSASPKTVTLGASASQPANYSLTLPLAAPGTTQAMISDSSGNLSWIFAVGSSFTPTATFTHGSGGTATISVTSATGVYTRVNNTATVHVVVGITTTAYTGVGTYTVQTTVPIIPNTLAPLGQTMGIFGGGNGFGILQPVSNTAVTSNQAQLTVNGNASGSIVFSYGYLIN